MAVAALLCREVVSCRPLLRSKVQRVKNSGRRALCSTHVPNWIEGRYSIATTPKVKVHDPATEEVIATIDATSEEEVTRIVGLARANFQQGEWRTSDAQTRFLVLTKAARLLAARVPEFARLESVQTGRPIREMSAQLARVPEWLDYFASLARTHEGSTTPFKGPMLNTLTYSPLGVVAQITPWNHPLLIATKKIAVGLATGNTLIVKPSELAPLSVLRLGPLLKEAGLPDGVLSIISGTGRETGKALCSSPGLAKIDLTGGLETYQSLAPVAARNLIPITAELGGKAPVLIFPSTPIDVGVSAVLFASFIATGQTCVTGSRILIHDAIYDEFVAELKRRTEALRVGDPLSHSTQIGALISRASVEKCQSFVETARGEGDRVLCGGSSVSVNGHGYFFQPTLIESTASSTLSCNEVFGPVIALIRCRSESAMIDVANTSDFALGASLWTQDFNQGHRVADAIEAGIVWVNGHHFNDPSSPWGGFKASGIGKENGLEAFKSYLKTKSTIFNYGQQVTWFDDSSASPSRYG